MAIKNRAKYLEKKYEIGLGTLCPVTHIGHDYACECTYYDYDDDWCGPSCPCRGKSVYEEVSPAAKFVADCIMQKIQSIATIEDTCKDEVLAEILVEYLYDAEEYKKDIADVCRFFKDTEIENKLFALLFGADRDSNEIP